MHENNFEKRVREKMDQLGFDPSDAVWEAVDNEINKEEKRRRPLFLLFFLSGLMLAGGGFYFNAIKSSSSRIIPGQQQTGTNEKQDKQSISKVQTGKTQGNELNEKTDNMVDKNTIDVLKWKGSRESKAIKSGKEGISSDTIMDFNGSKNKKPGQFSNSGKNDNDDVENIGQATSKIEPENAGKKGIDSSDSVSVINMAKSGIEKRKASLWNIGFTGNTGISNINQSLFQSANITGLYYNAPSVTGPNGAPAPIPVSSKISPGFSFGIGVFVNRYLSKRISFSAGINYHYYSTKIQTGNVVDSSLLIYYGSPQAFSVNGFYRNGSIHSYTNQYHFIELPVAMDFQLNKSRQIPVIWEAGLSLSYLINSNALHFDPYGSVYYQNTQLFNKIQINGTTAIMFGFHIHIGELQLGPQLQYGLTGLLKMSTGDPEHLFFGGLKISFIPGK
ncbi:MAG TPA: outer membrane beta-barrel protein [Puia sp.]